MSFYQDFYQSVKQSGMLYEYFPQCNGDWEHDKNILREEMEKMGITPSEHMK